jgi:hypothetical protein
MNPTRSEILPRKVGRHVVHPHRGYGTVPSINTVPCVVGLKIRVYLVRKNMNVFFSSFCQKLLSSAPSLSNVFVQYILYRYFLVYLSS